ncbi:hypothetical protein E2C01_073938 [Portunus trituberculatus]|uniref:Uncharacterized protein n=1 Tax=Portunus trituberculatus TaxID=210409 RepID=A0A5B7I225_PORTR|nr:hypothetical protein [Portunus trituberculatus]
MHKPGLKASERRQCVLETLREGATLARVTQADRLCLRMLLDDSCWRVSYRKVTAVATRNIQDCTLMYGTLSTSLG